jgi:DNA polymerase III subunit gamma/tau
MGTALYRQYRSTSFDEVIGQDHITSTLKNSLENGTIAHAYLLTGPRGVGKTSIARILAHAVNDLPYEKDGIHLDIIEIDAASNRRIDEIRSLREKVHIAPTSAKYKVYIIDEVHMLTREAFNALLKTLEEPPAHAIFILATTEIHKLPDTIVSRCITFTFRPIEPTDIVAHLKSIAQAENVAISDEALEVLAVHGDGSFRDSITLLDQVKDIGAERIEKTDIERMLGVAPETVVSSLFDAIIAGSPTQLDAVLKDTYIYGVSESHLTKQVASKVREELLSATPRLDSANCVELLQKLLDIPASPKPRVALELALLQTLFTLHPTQAVASPKPVVKAEPPAEKPKQKASKAPEPIPEPIKEEPTPVISTPPPVIEAGEPVEIWDTVLQELKKKNNTLYGIARMAKASQRDNTIVLTLSFAFHFKQLSQPKNKTILVDVIKAQNNMYDLEMTLSDAKKAAKSTQNDDLSNISDIFGAGEVLES